MANAKEGYLGVDENVGVLTTDAREGYEYVDENVGVLTVEAREAYLYVDENVGVNAQNAREAPLYVEEGDVDASIPTPHIWYLFPDHGRPGDGFAIVGHGFGDTQGALTGAAYLVALGLSIVSWAFVAGDAHALDAARQIRSLDDIADPEHQRIQVVVPPGAVTGLVTVTTDA